MERTMNGYASKAVAFATAIALAFALMLTIGAGQAQASEYTKHLASAKGTIAISYDKYCYINLWSNANAKPTAVKISNKSLASVRVSGGQITVSPKKTGVATLTYRWNHKKHTVKIKVYKYQNPIASLTIGGKQYKSKFSKCAFAFLGDLAGTKAAPTGTLKVKGAANWQIKKIWTTHYYGDKSIKNGSKITKSMSDVSVRMYNKKTKVIEDCCIDWY